MAKIVLFNKPCQVLSQFRAHENKITLAEFFSDKSLRLAGRLDYDSEGLLILTDDGQLAQRITHPRFDKQKSYWVQVDGEVSAAAIETLQQGVQLRDGMTRAATARRIEPPAGLWERDPPIRYRANIPTSWLEISIREGRNRQVRRMTAAVGFPALRLIRNAVADWQLGELRPGESTLISGAKPGF